MDDFYTPDPETSWGERNAVAEPLASALVGSTVLNARRRAEPRRQWTEALAGADYAGYVADMLAMQSRLDAELLALLEERS